MNSSKEEFAERRRQLAARISRQRTEFSEAYARLEQPIHYAEYGMRGFGFLRSNPWIFALIPAVVSAATFYFNWRRNKSAPPEVEAGPKPARGFFKTWFGRAAGAYQFYRRMKPFFL